MKRPIDRFKRLTAKRLRKDATRAEEILWPKLRRLELSGTHFRRQVPIGRFIADFACLTHRLIIEVDGSRHAKTDAASSDADRTLWLEKEGYRVVRFWNNEVMAQTNAVMEAIYSALLSTPPRPQEAGDPPPPGEGNAKPSSR